jgi:hypothetical protein
MTRRIRDFKTKISQGDTAMLYELQEPGSSTTYTVNTKLVTYVTDTPSTTSGHVAIGIVFAGGEKISMTIPELAWEGFRRTLYAGVAPDDRKGSTLS